MFKSLQWKLVLMFVLIVLSVMIVAGTFLLNSVSTFYHGQFKEKMSTEFEGELSKAALNAALAMDPVTRFNSILDDYMGRLGIGKSRNFYVLDGEGNLLIRSDLESSKLENSANLITALSGKTGEKVSVELPYMDYAYPVIVDGNVRFVIYINDNKQELLEVTHSIFTNILQALFLGVVIAMIIAFFLSKTITGPIRNLTSKARRIAEGNFESVIEVRSKDEIGTLTKTFNNMAGRLKNTLDEIESEKNKVEVILRYMADGVMAFNNEGRIIHINPAASEMLSLSRSGSYRFDTLFKKLGVDLKLRDAINPSSSKPKEWQVETKRGIIKLHFAPFKSETDRYEGVVAVLQDITEQQKLDNARRAFVADVSHELRTPLTNIKSYAETLLENDVEDSKTQKEFLAVIDSEADRMARLVADLLVLSQLDYGKQQLKRSLVSVEELVQRVIMKMTLDAKNHQHTLTYVAGTPPPEIKANTDRIEQVVSNIISNAIKYTPNGGVITVLCGQQEGYVYIKISDNGLGIPPEDIERIFDRFYRVDKARSREKGGTGLGLAIAKEIVEAHGGTISIESKLDEGTSVTIRLPISR